MRRLVARAPTRLDFGGGWTDVPPYSDIEGGYVCNIAIARYASVELATPGHADRNEPPFVAAVRRRTDLADVAVRLTSDFPVGSGLGGSSAAGVGLIGAADAWRGIESERSEMAERSRAIEIEDLGIAGGRQDHYAAAYGGALGLTFEANHTGVDPLPLPSTFVSALERRCVVVYTGQSRISGDTITAVLDAYRTRDIRVLTALQRMKELARDMAAAVRSADLDALGRLVGEHWRHQRSLHPAIPTPLIDAILTRASDLGALGGKALGASGGGCVLVVATEDNHERIRRELATMAEPLTFAVDSSGFRVVSDTPTTVNA